MYIRVYVYQYNIAVKYRCRLFVIIFHRDLCWQYDAALYQMFGPICQVVWLVMFDQVVGIVHWFATSVLLKCTTHSLFLVECKFICIFAAKFLYDKNDRVLIPPGKSNSKVQKVLDSFGCYIT